MWFRQAAALVWILSLKGQSAKSNMLFVSPMVPGVHHLDEAKEFWVWLVPKWESALGRLGNNHKEGWDTFNKKMEERQKGFLEVLKFLGLAFCCSLEDRTNQEKEKVPGKVFLG